MADPRIRKQSDSPVRASVTEPRMSRAAARRRKRSPFDALLAVSPGRPPLHSSALTSDSQVGHYEPIREVGPVSRPASTSSPACTGLQKSVAIVSVPGVLEASIEVRAGCLTRVTACVLDVGLATQGLTHGLSGRGWKVEVRTSGGSERDRNSRDERQRERGPENRERVERKDV
ncbi:MAG: hypothetical protein ACJAYU_000173 [Bradymonadia bacterium]|jgi:hypothetical protein